MKKRKKFIVLLIIIIILIPLLLPHKFCVTDGGSYGYTAILYEVTYWNSSLDLYPDSKKGVSLHVFPFFDFYFE